MVDYFMQGNNRRGCTAIKANGETHTISEWGRISNLNQATIRKRLHSGWKPEKAVTQRTRKEIYHG